MKSPEYIKRLKLLKRALQDIDKLLDCNRIHFDHLFSPITHIVNK